MGLRHLRVYHGPDQVSRTPAATALSQAEPQTVTVPLGDVIQALADAVRHRRSWLNDFANDEVTVSTDLYEIILAYQYYSRSAES